MDSPKNLLGYHLVKAPWLTDTVHSITPAFEAALAFHHGQRRKYTEEPYIVHPVGVARLVHDAYVARRLDYRAAVCAALLHDTLEDTTATPQVISALCRGFGLGGLVFSAVSFLTDPETKESGNRKARHQMKLVRFGEHLTKAFSFPETVEVIRSVKFADLIDNSDTIMRYDRKFAPVYMGEMSAMVEVLRPAMEESPSWDLYKVAKAILEDYQAGRTPRSEFPSFASIRDK